MKFMREMRVIVIEGPHMASNTREPLSKKQNKKKQTKKTNKKTRPNIRLLQSRAGGQGPYLRSFGQEP